MNDISLSDYYSRLDLEIPNEEKIDRYCCSLSQDDLHDVLVDLAIDNRKQLIPLLECCVSHYRSHTQVPIGEVGNIVQCCFDLLKAIDKDLIDLHDRDLSGLIEDSI